jgi:hypothetical protein
MVRLDEAEKRNWHDNGYVVGYDNAHGYHHRHFKGSIEPIDFINFEDVEARFQRDWLALRNET